MIKELADQTLFVIPAKAGIQEKEKTEAKNFGLCRLKQLS